jgi:hypothetical protein
MNVHIVQPFTLALNLLLLLKLFAEIITTGFVKAGGFKGVYNGISAVSKILTEHMLT